MGQKVHPKIQRIGVIKKWDSSWYAPRKKYIILFHQDVKIKEYIRKTLKDCGVSLIQILRNANETIININSAKPGVIIGHQGEQVEKFRDALEKNFGSRFQINIVEIQQPDLDAQLVAESIAKQVEKRISYRRGAKMAIQKAMEAGAKGAKVYVSGRLNGVEIARDETFTEGKIPLQTFRADVDYGVCPAFTTYGAIGVRVWIYKGDIFKKDLSATINPYSKPLGEKAAKKVEPKIEEVVKEKKVRKITSKKA